MEGKFLQTASFWACARPPLPMWPQSWSSHSSAQIMPDSRATSHGRHTSDEALAAIACFCSMVGCRRGLLRMINSIRALPVFVRQSLRRRTLGGATPMSTRDPTLFRGCRGSGRPAGGKATSRNERLVSRNWQCSKQSFVDGSGWPSAG